MLKTVKFGGSSLADAAQFRKCAAIIHSDASRRYVVVSAPGKRNWNDIKITDLLYRCCDAAQNDLDFSDSFSLVRERYCEIVRELGLDLDLNPKLDHIEAKLRSKVDRDYAGSRGEYLSAMVMAAYLDWPLIDSEDYILFREDGSFDAEATQEKLSFILEGIPRAVFPGFYGGMPDGKVRTFSRGGSDISGAIVARASASDLYENWTDVSGLFSCDPRIVENPAPIDVISYAELRELAYMGASVLHESAIFPVKAAGIPVNIRNTNDPDAPGTMIQTNPKERGGRTITGIAGRGCYTSIMIEKDQMNETVGFAMRVLQVLARHNIIVEHIPTGIDIMSVIVPSDQLATKRDEVMAELWAETQADSIKLNENMALLTVVGQGMKNQLGAAGRVFSALGRAGINVNMIDQGSDELNLIIGIDAEDLNPAIRALYSEFFH